MNLSTFISQGIVFLWFSYPVQAQFQDVSEQLGSIYTSSSSFNGNGLSFYDFNKDGWDDLTISKGTGNPLFFENQEGTFVPVNFYIPSFNQNIITMIWADYDNDGDEDLLITKKDGPIELWNNDGFFNFTNVAAEAGFLSGNYNHNGAAFADYDHDGFLDLYIAKFYIDVSDEQHVEGKLYRNNGDGTFTDATFFAGVHLSEMLQFQPVFFDYNKDGWEDLFIIVDRAVFRNYLFENNQDGTFTDVSEQTGMALYFEPMSASVADFDNDLDLDVYMTNSMNFGGNHLMVNDNNVGFANQAATYNVNMNHRSWGAVWLDYDNDSWLDLFVSLQEPFNPPYSGNEFYINQQAESFVSGRQLVGLANDFSSTYTCARGDINNDGYFDLAFSNSPGYPFKLYQNTGGNNHFFSLSLEGTYSNKNGIGSWIHCYAEGKSYARYTQCGENLIAQNSGKEIFGLGNIELIDSLVIDWSRGTREVYYNIDVNQHLHFIEGASLSVPFDIGYLTDLFLCEGDSMVLSAGNYHSYFWNTGDTMPNLTIYQPGEYFVTVVNQFGFEIESNPVVVNNAPVNDVEVLVTNVSCFGAMDGQAQVSFSNNPALSFIWNTGDSVPQIYGLEGAVYSFIGVDNFGCTFLGSAFVEEPAPLVASVNVIHPNCFGENNGSIEVALVGGTAPYSIQITNNNTTQLFAGVYNIMISDSNECLLFVEAELLNPQELSLQLDITHVSETNLNGTANLSVFGGTGNHQIVWSTGLEDVYEISNLPAGDYWVLVTDENDCFVQHDFVIENTTSVYQNLKSNIAVYPNPFDNCFRVNAAPGTSFSLYNNQGKLVLTFIATENVTSFCLSELGAGLYTLVSISENEIQRTKLIKL